MKKIVLYRQHDIMDCGPTCLRIIGRWFGKKFDIQKLRDSCNIGKEGVSLFGIGKAAEKLGFRTKGVRLNFEQVQEVELPCILHWNQNHFVVLYKIRKNKFFVADPAKDLITYDSDEFKKHWLSNRHSEEWKGIALLLSPTPLFYALEDDEKVDLLDFKYMLTYFYKYRSMVIQLFIGLIFGSLLTLVLPFLSQAMVDIGINSKRLGFATIILIAQSIILLSRTSVDFMRSWILLHMSNRINLEVLTDFLIKLMKLPISYFDSKMTGDIMQRMSDQRRIESFLTGTALNTLFSLFNITIYAIILAYYSINLFSILFVGSFVYSIWIYIFLKFRKDLDNKQFEIASKNQNTVVQLIAGMQEIKMHNSEQQKRWDWEKLQATLFKFRIKQLSLGQIESAGGFFINESKNLVLSYIVVSSVIKGDLTFGSMVAVQFIIGQLNSPINQVISFVQQLQDAKLSLERLNQIHTLEDEENAEKFYKNDLPLSKSITLSNVTFAYPGPSSDSVLKGINLCIEEGKTTAIVGMSGSGKTTILKLLLRFHQPQSGEIRIGNERLDNISFKTWRNECGAVMQDPFLFSDTIANNIAVGDEYPKRERLENAIKIANLEEFISELPLGLETRIGAEGKGISQGQRQRIQIARAAYKSSSFILFDEATNSLDANNEKKIMENLKTFFKNKTVIIVAHRLSTIRDADSIVLLEKGEIIEKGTHQSLLDLKGKYYDLVSNQMQSLQ